jgi:hypothetical protein
MTPRGISTSSPRRRFFLLKTGIFRRRQPGDPAKTSILLETLVLVASILLVAAMLFIVISRLHHG